MKFNCKKTGFSLAETLIVLLIITVLVIFSITAVRTRATTTPLLYQRAYEALDDATYNGYLQADAEGKVFAGDSTNLANPFGNTAKNLQTLCEQLAGPDGYINTISESVNCGREGLAIPIPGDENFTQDNAHFIATNGMRFYISAERRGINSNYINSRDEAMNPRWYIVFVDLDGEKGLGTMAQPADQNNTADVVPFALVLPPDQRPVVIPIGVPTMDRRYMTAVVRYVDNGGDRDRLSPSLRYKEAIIRAYGSQEGSSSSVRIRRPERIYFESYLSGNSLFHVALPLTTGANAATLDDNSKAPPPFGIANPGCEVDAYGLCSVIINSYSGASGR